MTKPPPHVHLSPDVNTWFRCAVEAPWLAAKFKKAKKAVKLMREIGPSYPGFCTHGMQNLKGPDDRTIYNSYVENKTPGAWRMYWIYDDNGGVYIISIGPHDHTPGDQTPVKR